MTIETAEDAETRGGAASGDDERLRALLSQARIIAVVGAKDDESADAHRIPRYLQQHGYRVVPVNPKRKRILGERVLRSLADLGPDDPPVDLVNLFRAPDHIPAHVDEILAMNPLPRTVWMQLGIVHGAAAARLRAAGIEVVQDRCIMVDHRRLLG